ncbi:MAG TPA: YdeI/OmpD-associated family protein [Candidatus Saccharimonadales bacterium]|nr:YdeI/OmpD-associated family protein [Candidatus Saccharimonadales bacterium]
MADTKISEGVAHKLPADLRKALLSDKSALEKWEDITPLARNEWICWTVTVKQQKTRDEHVKRTVSELKAGKRRPCCWIGCIHRSDKAMSKSQKWVLGVIK